MYNEIQEWFNDFIDTKAVNAEGFFSLRVMELFFKQKNFDVSVILKVLDDLIDGSRDNLAKVEQAYELKQNVYLN
ncbi:MAG: hypothetical protein ACLTRS_10615 [Lachnospiraceae bacterium]